MSPPLESTSPQRRCPELCLSSPLALAHWVCSSGEGNGSNLCSNDDPKWANGSLQLYEYHKPMVRLACIGVTASDR